MKTERQPQQEVGELGAMDELLRARCRKDLKYLAKRAAQILQLDEADIIRIGTRNYAASVVYKAVPNAT